MNTASLNRSRLAPLRALLPCSGDWLTYCNNLYQYQDRLTHHQIPIVGLECRRDASFEQLATQRRLDSVTVSVQARTAMRIEWASRGWGTLVLSLAGSMRIRKDGGTFDIAPDVETLIGRGNAPGEIEFSQGASVLVSFDPAAVDETIAAISARDDIHVPERPLVVSSEVLIKHGHLEALKGVVRLAFMDAGRPGFIGEKLSADLLLRSVALMTIDAFAVSERGTSARDASFATARARNYIHDRLGEEITLSELERAAGVSRRSLQMQFQKLYGLSPLQYLREQRLIAARRMLEAGNDVSVTSVAMMCGFTHMSAFSALFRARFGCSPREVARGRWA